MPVGGTAGAMARGAGESTTSGLQGQLVTGQHGNEVVGDIDTATPPVIAPPRAHRDQRSTCHRPTKHSLCEPGEDAMEYDPDQARTAALTSTHSPTIGAPAARRSSSPAIRARRQRRGLRTSRADCEPSR
jgi:hypothetical protein